LHTAGEMGAGPFFAFCGIGNPRAFVRDLERWGFSTCGQMFFADHHEYSSADLQAIEFAAAECGANALVTTEKDSWNLRKATFPTMPVYVAIIDMEITNDADLLTMVRDVIKRRGLQHRGAA
ncbi:MAG: tetraacyldisaccharide 4'-kinase, partial [Acidobacteriota bacterium]|nr:tetraacyldisaccharide 4'-kinase [Acidobacteriota bacterium]